MISLSIWSLMALQFSYWMSCSHDSSSRKNDLVKIEYLIYIHYSSCFDGRCQFTHSPIPRVLFGSKTFGQGHGGQTCVINQDCNSPMIFSFHSHHWLPFLIAPPPPLVGFMVVQGPMFLYLRREVFSDLASPCLSYL